jgi:hypothetical protein
MQEPGGRQITDPSAMMKTNNPSENDETLSRVLREWPVETKLPPHFRENVWERIEKSAPASEISLWLWLQNWIASILPRPKVAFSYVTALLLIGVVAGFWEAKARGNRADTALSSRYVQSVDPYFVHSTNP